MGTQQREQLQQRSSYAMTVAMMIRTVIDAAAGCCCQDVDVAVEAVDAGVVAKKCIRSSSAVVVAAAALVFVVVLVDEGSIDGDDDDCGCEMLVRDDHDASSSVMLMSSPLLPALVVGHGRNTDVVDILPRAVTPRRQCRIASHRTHSGRNQIVPSAFMYRVRETKWIWIDCVIIQVRQAVDDIPWSMLSSKLNS
jgi:hypothetical protein